MAETEMGAIDTSADPTLAELVNARRGAARVLEHHQLDYCCGGARHLRAACAERGVDAQRVLREIEALGPQPPPSWAHLGPADLADHIESTHHRHLHEELPRLSALAQRVAAVHGDRHPELALVEATFIELRADLEPHLRSEEELLFPMIRELAVAGRHATDHDEPLARSIRVLRSEHDRAGELLSQLRSLSFAYAVPDDACASYRSLYEGLADLEVDTHLHVHKENDLLFTAAVEQGRRPGPRC